MGEAASKKKNTVHQWQKEFAATVLKNATPLDIRERIGGHNQRQQHAISRAKLSARAQLLLREFARDPDDLKSVTALLRDVHEKAGVASTETSKVMPSYPSRACECMHDL